MRRLSLCVIAATVLLAPATASADELTGRLLVEIEPATSNAEQRGAISRAGADRSGIAIPDAGVVSVKAGPGETLSQVARALRTDPAVKSVAVERRHKLRFVPNDPVLAEPETTSGTPAGTTRQWWAQKSGLYEAWNLARGAGAVVAVIDSGADVNHPDLEGKVLGSFDYANSGSSTTDGNGHGTHVSGLACGGGNNGTGVVGAGLDCKLLIYKSDLSDGSIAAAIRDAADRGAGAINMSFGTDGTTAPPPALVSAIDHAVSKNVVLVAAAADDPVEEQGDPANILQPTGTGADLNAGKGLSITAANFAGARASFAGRGSQISMSGYGHFADGAGPRGILSTFPGNGTEIEQGSGNLLFPTPPCNCRTVVGSDNRYAYLAGTSMSTPMVAGVAAMIRAQNPDLSAAEVVRLLKQHASRPAGSGWNPETGWGILNAGPAVAAAAVIDRRPPSSKLKGSKRIKRATRTNLRLSGTDVAGGIVRPAGIARYEVWRAANRAKKYRKYKTTTKSKLRIGVKRGSRYRFYTIAVDKLGNREAAPSKPDLTMRIDRRKR